MSVSFILLVWGALAEAVAIGSTISSAISLVNTNKLKKEVEKLVKKNQEFHKKIEEISQELKALILNYEVERAKNVATYGNLFKLLPTIASLSLSFLKMKLAFYRSLKLNSKGEFNIQLLRIFNIT